MFAALGRRFIRAFDTFLRRVLGVFEFTQDPRCILRLGRTRCPYDLRLSDGTLLHRGEPLLELHLWNEHLPPMPPGGADVAWTVRFLQLWKHSVALLARYWQNHPEFSPIPAVHGIFALPGGEDLALQKRTLETMGFDVLLPRRTPWRVFASFWENLYNWAIIWTFNPASLRVRKLVQMRRCHVWMSRRRLLERYAAPTGQVAGRPQIGYNKGEEAGGGSA
jgi:hypothetical protein